MLFNAVNDIKLAGVYITDNATINGGNDVVISNSNKVSSDYDIIDMNKGISATTDYNSTKFNDATFQTVATTLGYGSSEYGAGTRISRIGGDLDITNVNSVVLVNTAIEGNLTESNVSNDATLVRSAVGGNYTPDRNTIGSAENAGEVSVYQSFIKKDYSPKYINTSNPPPVNINEINQLRYGSQLDTSFRQQFSPKGFAANQDELKAMKKTTISHMTKGNGNSIKLNNTFKAY